MAWPESSKKMEYKIEYACQSIPCKTCLQAERCAKQSARIKGWHLQKRYSVPLSKAKCRVLLGLLDLTLCPYALSVTVIANQALTAAWLSEFVSKQKTLEMPWKVKTPDHFQGLLCQTCHCDAFHGSIALAKSISPCRAARSGSPGPQKPRTKGNQAKPAPAAMAAIQAIKMVEPHVRMHGIDYCSQPKHARRPHSCYSKCLTS